MKDEQWVDAVGDTIKEQRKRHWDSVAQERRRDREEIEHRVSMSDDLYRTMSDESLNDMKHKVLEEYKRRQDERYEKLVQRQLEKSMDMYMDYSETEEETVYDVQRNLKTELH